MTTNLSSLIERIERLGDPDQGMHYEAAHHGKRKFDPDTGRPYLSRGRPSTLTIYGERAETILRVIENAKEIAAALKARNHSHEG